MKQVSLNEIGFILRPPDLFVKSRRLTRSSKKTDKTDLSGYVDEVTDLIMGAIEITQNSCLRVLLEPQSMALILDKLPEDALKKHREQKRDNGIIESLIEKAALVVPSGIEHGPLMPIIRSMALPMLKYYFVQSDKSIKKIMQLMDALGLVDYTIMNTICI